jgi:anti-sigma factor RsiW
MTCENYPERLSALIDGELSAEEHEDAAAHLQGCPACRQLEAELRRIKDAAPGLSTSRQSVDDAWNKIEQILRTSSSGVPNLSHRANGRRWALAVAAAVLAVAMPLIWYLKPSRERSVERTAAVELAHLQHQQERATVALRAVVQQRRAHWDATLERTFVKNASIIDKSLAECRLALRNRPADVLLRARLAAAYQRRIEFLRLFTQMEEVP